MRPSAPDAPGRSSGRRGFTLIELLTIVAIIAIMVTASVVSVRSGQGAARVKSAVRDVFATIRHARSTALVTQQPSIITYSVKQVDDEPCACVEVTSAKIMSAGGVVTAFTLKGDRVTLGGDDGPAPDAEGESAEASGGGGETIEEILFAPIKSDVVKGMRLKVLMEGEELSPADAGRAKSKLSVFSNVDYLIGRYHDAKSETEKKDEPAETAKPAALNDDQEPVSIVWEVNGRTTPHRVYVYPDGRAPEDGLCISIDRFGAAKVLAEDER